MAIKQSIKCVLQGFFMTLFIMFICGLFVFMATGFSETKRSEIEWTDEERGFAMAFFAGMTTFTTSAFLIRSAILEAKNR